MFINIIKKRLREGSTWKGILSLLTGLGLFSLTTAQAESIASACTAVYIALSVLMPDKFSGESPEDERENDGE